MRGVLDASECRITRKLEKRLIANKVTSGTPLVFFQIPWAHQYPAHLFRAQPRIPAYKNRGQEIDW
jgi:hypothetical protein